MLSGICNTGEAVSDGCWTAGELCTRRYVRVVQLGEHTPSFEEHIRGQEREAGSGKQHGSSGK